MRQLIRYIIALSNLYGMVHKDKVLEIYNSQNEDHVSLADVEEFFTSPPEELEDSFIYSHQDYFVHQTILENDDFESMLKKKGDKPHYVPKKNELLKYVDEWYFEKTKQYNTLLKCVKENFFKDSDEKAEWLCEDIYGICQFGANMQVVLDAFNNQGINFDDMDQVNEVMQLVMDLSNNIRIWENNGHTPHEIFEKVEKPHLRSLPDKPYEFKDPNVIDMKTRKKIGRNEPCPCGSGKKYKKCCLGK
ncbi:SEC-C metal-binding domain-containing protein [Proteinivorax hydrogeniformans]|uniref:SEC-C metal-binding domain-containing protein n=1 Tax=Proteinivorax hydrogeniformans TaxID=1826727 RepID=A0AAU8HX25_9FIRM